VVVRQLGEKIMRRSVAMVSALVAAAAGLGVAAVAGADNNGRPMRVRAQLTGYAEVAPVGGALSTTGRGTFRAEIDEATPSITYTLKFSNLEGQVTMSHLHFGQHHTNGGISVWLCQTATNPAPTSATPTCMADVTLSDTIYPTNVVGPAGQGIAPGQFEELVAAIRAGVV
jgi:hypothetical protein